MSVRPDEQALEHPISQILNGIQDFDKAVTQRIHAGEWKKEHLDELCKLRSEMIDLRNKLEALKEDTW